MVGAGRNLKKVIFRQGSGFHKTQFIVQMLREQSSGSERVFQEIWRDNPSRVFKEKKKERERKEMWPLTVRAELRQSTPNFAGTGCLGPQWIAGL